MRRLLLLAATALSLSACKGPCEQLGDRLCGCVGTGTTRDTCEAQVKNQLDSANPGKSVEDVCQAALDTCNAPSGAQFCEWVLTSCGKASCGLSAESYKDPAVCPP